MTKNHRPRDDGAAAASSSTSALQEDEDFPDPDEVNLDLTFDDIEEDYSSAAEVEIEGTMTNPRPISLNGDNNNDDDDVCCGKNKTSCSDNNNNNNMQDEYILGTLIVRVVAARDLNPVVNGGPLGNLFFGGGLGGGGRQRGGRNGSRGSGGGVGGAGGGSANPYASVRFGRTTQRTSEVFDSTSPTWPRGETMYMDVIHPAFTDKLYEEAQQQQQQQQAEEAEEEQQQQQQQTSSTASSSSSSASIPPVVPFDFETAASLSREVSREQNRQQQQQQMQQQQQQQNPGDPPQKGTTTTTVPAAAAASAPSPVPAAAAAAAASASSSTTTTTTSSTSSSSSPPRKKTSFESSSKYKNTKKNNNKTESSSSAKPTLPERPILTIAIFHANEIGSMHKHNPTKGGGSSSSGDSDDVFLGMAAVDLTMLLTGKNQTFDAWLPLSGTPDEQSSSHSHHHYPRSSVRIVCEYEASDDAPQPGDLVRFTGFCHEADLYPFHAGKLYKVEDPLERNGSSSSNALAAAARGDLILLSWTSPEGWISSAMVHRFMVVCEHRALHHQGPMEYYQEEIASFTERLVHSPMVHVVQDAYERLPDEGLAAITQEVWNGGASLLQRWMQGGLQTVVHDVIHATNVDGHANPTTDESVLDTEDMEDYDDDNAAATAGAAALSGDNNNQDESSSDGKSSTPRLLQQQQQQQAKQQQQQFASPLPNMPPCPITGQAMVDPVVAADGHTYERSAIARWLRTSDKSPLTGSVLDHKNLVPNFMLLSSLQEAAAAAAKAAAAAHNDMTTPTKLHPKMTSSSSAMSTTATAASAATPQQKGTRNKNKDREDEDLILDDADLLIDEELL